MSRCRVDEAIDEYRSRERWVASLVVHATLGAIGGAVLLIAVVLW